MIYSKNVVFKELKRLRNNNNNIKIYKEKRIINKFYNKENYIFIFNNVPQLIPFYFLNQLSFLFLTLIVLIYVLSKYILPLFTYRNVVRLYITKLTDKS